MRLDCVAEKAQLKTDSKGTFTIQWMLVLVSLLPLTLYHSMLLRNQTSDEGNRRFSRLSLLGSHVAVDLIPMVIYLRHGGISCHPNESPSRLILDSLHADININTPPSADTNPERRLPSTCLKEIPNNTRYYVSVDFSVF